MKLRLLGASFGAALAIGVTACSPAPQPSATLFRDPVAPGTCLLNGGLPAASLRYDGPADSWGNASYVETPITPQGCATAPLADTTEYTLVKESNASRAKALCILLAPSDLQLGPGQTLDQAISVTNLLTAAFADAPSDVYVCNVSRTV